MVAGKEWAGEASGMKIGSVGSLFLKDCLVSFHTKSCFSF